MVRGGVNGADHGALGAVVGVANATNPLYGVGVTGANVKIAVEHGDVEKAAEGVTSLVLTGVSVVVAAKLGAAEAGSSAIGEGLTRRQAAMLDQLRAGDDVIVRNVAEGRLLLENSGLKPFTSQRYLPAAPAPRGTYRGDLLHTADPTAPFVHPPGTAPPEHALGPHFNLYFFDGAKAAIIIRT